MKHRPVCSTFHSVSGQGTWMKGWKRIVSGLLSNFKQPEVVADRTDWNVPSKSDWESLKELMRKMRASAQAITVRHLWWNISVTENEDVKSEFWLRQNSRLILLLRNFFSKRGDNGSGRLEKNEVDNFFVLFLFLVFWYLLNRFHSRAALLYLSPFLRWAILAGTKIAIPHPGDWPVEGQHGPRRKSADPVRDRLGRRDERGPRAAASGYLQENTGRQIFPSFSWVNSL